jgi:hypothetical protein
MDHQQTTQTRRYPLDIAQMQSIVRQVLADPAYSDLWEPAYGGMITVRFRTFACHLQVSWKQEHSGTELSVAVLAPPVWGKPIDYYLIPRRALEYFLTALDQAATLAIANPIDQPEA